MCWWERTQPERPSPSASFPSSPGACWPPWPTSATRPGWTTLCRTTRTPPPTPAQPTPPTRARRWTATSSLLSLRTPRPPRVTSLPLCTEPPKGMVTGQGGCLGGRPWVLDSSRPQGVPPGAAVGAQAPAGEPPPPVPECPGPGSTHPPQGIFKEEFLARHASPLLMVPSPAWQPEVLPCCSDKCLRFPKPTGSQALAQACVATGSWGSLPKMRPGGLPLAGAGVGLALPSSSLRSARLCLSALSAPGGFWELSLAGALPCLP